MKNNTTRQIGVDEIIEYRNSLLAEFDNAFIQEGLTSQESFVMYAMDSLESTGAIDSYDMVPFSGGTGEFVAGRERKAQIDAYSFSELDGIFNIYVALYDGDEELVTLNTSDFTSRAVNLARNFIQDRTSIKKNAPEASNYLDCIDTIDECLERELLRRFRICVITDALAGERVNFQKVRELEGKPVDFIIYDIKKLRDISFAIEGRGTLEIDFTEFTKPIICVPASKPGDNGQYDSYIGVMPGEVLADIYDKYGSRLLEGNVRSFLSSRGPTNKRIRETLLGHPEQFFAFNNGISVTAENVKFDKNGRMTFAEEFQIINGGQTTASISQVRYKDKAVISSVNVMMKLTVLHEGVEEDQKQQLLENISRASNQQNKVTDADFFSTHPFHLAMENLSKNWLTPPTETQTLQTHWFYERARGQYEQRQLKMNKTQRLKFKAEYPKKQVITKPLLAKYRNSWDMLPYIVSKGAEANLQYFAGTISRDKVEWDTISKNYNNPLYFKETVALAIMFNTVGSIVSEQDWYEGSFRANIVTYSIAMLRYLMCEQMPNYELDLELIWKNQDVGYCLKQVFKKLTTLVNDEITNTRNGLVNMTQRCKQKKFWEEMQEQIDLDLSEFSKFKSICISKSTVESRKGKATIQGELLTTVDAQNAVMEKPQGFWIRVKQFVYDKHIFARREEQLALNVCLKMNYLEKKSQCKALLTLLDRCKENGFIEE